MAGLLQFSPPKLKEDPKGVELLLPAYGSADTGFRFEKLVEGPSTYRNVVAWYLKAAGLKTATIGEYLSISASRAGALASRTRDQMYVGETLDNAKLTGKAEGVSKGLLPAHMFVAMRKEMRAAEHALDRCCKARLFIVSGALRKGRAAYLQALEPVLGLKCPCNLCAFKSGDFRPYWLK